MHAAILNEASSTDQDYSVLNSNDASKMSKNDEN